MLTRGISILFIFISIILSRNLISTQLRCRCLMNDLNCWPNASVWEKFNKSVDGRLISVRPPAGYCSGNPPDIDECRHALEQWTNATWRSEQVGAMQSHNWENTTCTEHFGNVSCTQGSVPQLAVNATTIEHVQKTIRFSSINNLRLVTKTSGHDFLGRSTAADSLLLWLHYMKTMDLISNYTTCTNEHITNAIRIGAGVQWGEVYRWLSPNKSIAIGGASSTVGAIGGFLQGGGHGPLTRWKGMAADQVLEFDVVTADGERKTVNICENKDLFWALRGGGGGSFALVLSAVLRTFPSPTMVSTLYLVSATNETRYSHFVRDFIRFMPILADIGHAGYFYMSDLSIAFAFFVPNGNFSMIDTLFEQFKNNNTDLQWTGNSTFLFPTFYDYFSQIMEKSNPTGGNVLLGSRLISETIIREKSDQVADAFVQARGTSETQSVLIGHLVAGGQVSNRSIDNSVNPLWRTTLLHVIYSQGWEENATIADKEKLMSRIRTQVDILEKVTGDTPSGCYLNEADPNEPNWEQKFFGTQTIYNRLKSIKKTYDPNHLFICKNCVGSDDWSTDLNCPKRSKAIRLQTTIFFLFFLINIIIK